jgi:hypothetical protein
MAQLNRRNRRRTRRGATLVFVAIFSVVLIAIAGFAVDISRLYMGTAELQTAADAGALRGALEFQRASGVSPADSARVIIRNNLALGDTAASEVLPAFWTPGTGGASGVLDTNRTWGTANAVWVRTTRSTGLLFGRILSAVNPAPKRQAAAWIANITSVKCPMPWGFPVAELNEHLYNHPENSNYLTVGDSTYSDLTEKQKTLSGQRELTMAFWPPTQLANSGPQMPDSAGADGNFYALASNVNNYADQIASNGANCTAQDGFTIGESEGVATDFSGQGPGSIQKKTVNGLDGSGPANGYDGLCETNNLPNNGRADCWPLGTPAATINSSANMTPGVDVVVAWLGTYNAGSGTAPVVTIGGFRVMCVYRKNNDTCPWMESAAWPSAAGSNGAWFTAAGYKAPYDEGTIIGYPVTIDPKLNAGTVLGTDPSLAQRLILVR